MDFGDFIEGLRGRPGYKGQIAHARYIPAHAPRFGRLEHALNPRLQEWLRERGIDRLYTHQAAAIEAVRAGRHTAVVTPTASGKTLCYNLPVLDALLDDPERRALYLFPTKALAQDQLDALAAFGMPEVPAAVYDGDTPPRQRRAAREGARILLSNPDMLHVGILPQHFRWRQFFGRLRFVVLDEMHAYRGVFGSNVAGVLRRLRRVCALHGSDPTFICTSATVANPGEFAERLLGLPVEVVDDSGAPGGPRWFVLWNPPPVVEREGAGGASDAVGWPDQERKMPGGAGAFKRRAAWRRSAIGESTDLFVDLVGRDVRTIAFTKARKATELIARYAADRLSREAPHSAGRISPYRAGYLPEDRRRIERRLFDGDLVGVVSTSALELGVDVGGLDAALLVGFPGTIASTWQRAGRAGRGSEQSLAVMVAQDDALDQYLVRHPDYLFESPCEHAIIDPENPYILARHLSCAAAEVALVGADVDLFGGRSRDLIQLMVDAGDLITRRGRWYWAGRNRYPAQEVDIRSASGATFLIVGADRRTIGTVDEARAFEQVHPGAIYLHQGETYLVTSLDLEARIARVAPTAAGYHTQPRSSTDLDVLHADASKPWGPALVRIGEVEVWTQVTGFARKQLFTDTVLDVQPLELPPQRMRTSALWIELPEALAREVHMRGFDLAGGVHAVEHAAIGVLPLFAMCDRWDVGGVSYPAHPSTGAPAIFIYDGYPGGVGIAEKGYLLLEALLAATLEVIEACSCEVGCPGCVQSPKCGNLNDPLDKQAALLILKWLKERAGTAAGADGGAPGSPDEEMWNGHAEGWEP